MALQKKISKKKEREYNSPAKKYRLARRVRVKKDALGKLRYERG